MYRRNRMMNIQLQKGIKWGLYVLSFAAAVLLTGNTAFATDMSDVYTNIDNKNENSVNTDNVEVTDTETKEEAGKIVTKNGKKYYEYANGKKAKNQFVTIKKKTYYFGKKGVMVKGWMKKDSNYYYFDRNTGAQKIGGTVDGIKLDKSGKAKKTSYNKKKIETMITANSIMNKVTKPTDTKEQKLKKVFDWVLKHPYHRYRYYHEAKAKKGWEMTYANDVYEKGDGCCASEACALAFLAHECGYKTVYICDDTGHVWVEINGRVYDTLFAEAKNYKKYYNSDYKTARLHCINKKKI